MEFLVLLFLILAAAFALFGSFSKHSKLPPGKLGLPFVGETLNFMSKNLSNKGVEFFDERLRKYGPVFKTSLYGDKIVVLPAPQGNQFIFLNENKGLEASWPKSVQIILGKNSISSLTGEQHRRSKALLMTFLRPETLQGFVTRMSKMAMDHLDKYWKGQNIVYLHASVKKFTFTLAGNLLMGLDPWDEEIDVLAEDFNAMVRGMFQMPLDFPGTEFHRGKAARARLDSAWDKHIKKRKDDLNTGKASSKQDMLSVLLTTRDENGQLGSDETIKDNFASLLFAGHDTSSAALTMVYKFLAENPACLNRVIQENRDLRATKGDSHELCWEDLRKLKYTWLVVQETMRIQPPIGMGIRKATEDLHFGDYIIPKGWKILWSVYTSFLRDEFFDDPHKFDPSRFEKDPAPYTFAPFGGGVRVCPGNDFAKMEILVFLHYSILLFEWELVDPQEEFSVNPLLAPKKGLHIKVRARN